METIAEEDSFDSLKTPMMTKNKLSSNSEITNL